MRHYRLLAAASFAAIACTATPAFAQDVSGQTDEQATDEEGVIIVTARRQNERLQDVPASVSVLTSDALAKTGADNAEEFVALTRR